MFNGRFIIGPSQVPAFSKGLQMFPRHPFPVRVLRKHVQSNMQAGPAAGFLKTDGSAGKWERITLRRFYKYKFTDNRKRGVRREMILAWGMGGSGAKV